MSFKGPLCFPIRQKGFESVNLIYQAEHSLAFIWTLKLIKMQGSYYKVVSYTLTSGEHFPATPSVRLSALSMVLKVAACQWSPCGVRQRGGERIDISSS